MFISFFYQFSLNKLKMDANNSEALVCSVVNGREVTVSYAARVRTPASCLSFIASF